MAGMHYAKNLILLDIVGLKFYDETKVIEVKSPLELRILCAEVASYSCYTGWLGDWWDRQEVNDELKTVGPDSTLLLWLFWYMKNEAHSDQHLGGWMSTVLKEECFPEPGQQHFQNFCGKGRWSLCIVMDREIVCMCKDCSGWRRGLRKKKGSKKGMYKGRSREGN